MALSTLPRTQAQVLLGVRWDICLGCEMPSVRNSFITKSQCVHWESGHKLEIWARPELDLGLVVVAIDHV